MTFFFLFVDIFICWYYSLYFIENSYVN